MNVQKDSRNGLLKRRDVEVVIESAINPGFEGAKKLLIGHFKAGDDLIVVRAVRGHFGRHDFLIEASIYDDIKHKELIEQKAKPKKGAA